ncbi:unnamed protein product [Agarophyton chilense]
MHQIFVPVSCATPWLVILKYHPRLAHRQLTLMANGIVDNIPNQPFKLCLSNFSSHDMKLPKNTNVGIALPAPQGVFTVAHTDLGEVAFDKEGGCVNASTTTKVSINTNLEAKVTDKASVDIEEEPDPERQWQDTVQIGEEKRQRGRIIDLLEVFETMWSGHLGQIKATQHRIELLPDSKPIYQQPYHAGPKAREVELKAVEQMLQEGVIEPANSDWASPVVLVQMKGDNRMRFCVDYRRLNSVTIRDSYPIPRKNECIDSLEDAQIFTTLDANCGYWQVPVGEEYRDKTTFTCHFGLFCFTRMPFGLRNAPAIFQRALDIILSKVKWTTALI